MKDLGHFPMSEKPGKIHRLSAAGAERDPRTQEGERGMKTDRHLGFVGLGVMGEPMCANLVAKTSLPVYGTDLKRDPVARLATKGERLRHDRRGHARGRCHLPSLHSPKAVEEVCNAIAEAKGRTHIIIDMSTTPVKLTRVLHERLAAHGITLVDAPVAGMRARAHAGTLSIMVGADAGGLCRRTSPHLAYMGEATHCGAVSFGQVVKALNNMVVFMTVNALAEAITIGRRGGHRRQTPVRDHVEGFLRLCCAAHPGAEAPRAGSFPEDAFPTDYALKDIGLALELARDVGVNAPAARHTRDLLEATSRAGYGRNYYPAMVKLIEKG